jgi:hypothetical protein
MSKPAPNKSLDASGGNVSHQQFCNPKCTNVVKNRKFDSIKKRADTDNLAGLLAARKTN